jgi:hypothetical protein
VDELTKYKVCIAMSARIGMLFVDMFGKEILFPAALMFVMGQGYNKSYQMTALVTFSVFVYVLYFFRAGIA